MNLYQFYLFFNFFLLMVFINNLTAVFVKSIELKKKVFEGDYLIAKSNEIKRGSKNAQFEINITNQDDELVAYFKGDVYISSKKWDLEQMN